MTPLHVLRAISVIICLYVSYIIYFFICTTTCSNLARLTLLTMKLTNLQYKADCIKVISTSKLPTPLAVGTYTLWGENFY